jgi:hypothetical protein
LLPGEELKVQPKTQRENEKRKKRYDAKLTA